MKLKISSWNLRGLNKPVKRSSVKVIDIRCLQETSIVDWSSSMIQKIWGNNWASWAKLKASGMRGRVIILRDKILWNCVDIQHRYIYYLVYV